MDRRQIIRNYFQSRHLANDRLRGLYIEPFVEVMGLLSDYAETLQMFGSVDEIPTEFLEDLAVHMAYEYEQDEDPDVQREIIKRVLSIYRNRATHASLAKTLQYSTDYNWAGENLTYYHGPLRGGGYDITYPRDYLFTHDKSRHDSNDHFMDYLHWNLGIIDLEVEFFSSRTIEMLERQIPAGVRYWITQQVNFNFGGDGDGINRYTSDITYLEYIEDLLLHTDSVYIPSEVAEFDRLSTGILVPPRSGRFVSMALYDEELELLSTYLPGMYGVIDSWFNTNRYFFHGGWIGEWYDYLLARIFGVSPAAQDLQTRIPGPRIWDVSAHDDGKAWDGLYHGVNWLESYYTLMELMPMHDVAILDPGGFGAPNDYIIKDEPFTFVADVMLNKQVGGFDIDCWTAGPRMWDVSSHDDGRAWDGLPAPTPEYYAKYEYGTEGVEYHTEFEVEQQKYTDNVAGADVLQKDTWIRGPKTFDLTSHDDGRTWDGLDRLGPESFAPNGSVEPSPEYILDGSLNNVSYSKDGIRFDAEQRPLWIPGPKRMDTTSHDDGRAWDGLLDSVRESE